MTKYKAGRGVEISFERLEQIIRAIDPGVVEPEFGLSSVEVDAQTEMVWIGFVALVDEPEERQTQTQEVAEAAAHGPNEFRLYVPRGAKAVGEGAPIPTVRWTTRDNGY